MCRHSSSVPTILRNDKTPLEQTHIHLHTQTKITIMPIQPQNSFTPRRRNPEEIQTCLTRRVRSAPPLHLNPTLPDQNLAAPSTSTPPPPTAHPNHNLGRPTSTRN
ncbi:hypothetical protein KC19_8G056700 [Ceratodon purpureus]|uniref:Uncharacterized protein n=1 Tax=Ceratodon purpureus TaxID=3225 RepID=A0A8T0GYV1_CERPU|nr:hypothetical protein KC19_8G056700 [Ceratodon purpureus]